MRKTWNYLLMAALVMGLGMNVTSCKDNDDDKTEEEKVQEAMEKSDRFWDVVGQLTSIDNYTPDYKGKTFEPSIGIASTDNPYVRIVNTGDMETAAQRFANLVGVSTITENTSSYEWKDDEVGTMTYHKSTDGQSLATVDVNIKQMPHLQQIIYRTELQAGENGTFEGTAWYRFGDIVKRTYQDANDSNKVKTEYWVCVRPAFGPAGKEDSHWISVSKPPKKNIYTVNGSNHIKYSVPQGIGKNPEHMQNLAEMLYAMLHPDDWKANLKDRTPTPKMWKDFVISKRFDYNNEKFFKNVRNYWDANNYFKLIFGLSSDELETSLTDHGLNLLYKGYHWLETFFWDLTLYQATYTNGTGKESNMHKEKFYSIEKNVQTIANIDVNNLYTEQRPYLQSSLFFGDDAPRYIIRHATGKDLCGRQPSVYTSMTSATNGVEDVYTYNALSGDPVGAQNQPKITEEVGLLNAPEVGCIVATNGKFYRTYNDAINYHATPIAVTVYVGNKYVDYKQNGPKYNCLAIGLIRSSSYYGSDDALRRICTFKCTQKEHFSGIRNGLEATETLVQGCGRGHKCHDVTTNIKNYNRDYKMEDNVNNFSQWFVPSVGQWIMALQSFGCTWDGSSMTFGAANADMWNKLTEPFKTKNILFQNLVMMTSTEMNHEKYYTIGIEKDESVFRETKKDSQTNIVPFIAFTYGAGATDGTDLVLESEEDKETRVGQIIGENGLFYKNAYQAREDNTTPAALVIYDGPQGSVEQDSTYRGMAVALEDLPGSYTMLNTYNFTCATPEITSVYNLLNNIKGIYNTRRQASGCENPNDHIHPAARACHAYNVIDEKTRRDKGFSDWFIPSSGQWIMALRDCGMAWNDGVEVNNVQDYTNIRKVFTDAGVGNDAFFKYSQYWMMTDYNANDAWTILISNTRGIVLEKQSKKQEALVRPFIAFK